jgi:hypothetical protein
LFWCDYWHLYILRIKDYLSSFQFTEHLVALEPPIPVTNIVSLPSTLAAQATSKVIGYLKGTVIEAVPLVPLVEAIYQESITNAGVPDVVPAVLNCIPEYVAFTSLNVVVPVIVSPKHTS